jgi:X-Pro dipeptidyl-peptidase
MSYRRLAAATLVAFAALVGPAAADPPPWLKVENGVTQPQFDFASAIEEVVYVESAVDSDNDGRRDRVRIRISRPGETESQGIKVPVVFEHSPYRGNTGNPANHNVDLDE